MNIATLGAFRLFFSGNRDVNVIALFDDERLHEARTFARMISGWDWIRSVGLLPMNASKDLYPSGKERFIGVVFGDNAIRVPLATNIELLWPTVPSTDDPLFGFFQELECHDFELGGLNEWRPDIPTSFSPAVLQSLSVDHIRGLFPFDAWQAVTKGLNWDGFTKLCCLDIGCGPIPKLRWGALQGWLHIVGVDPLNDLYTAIIRRHGYHELPKIRPDEILSGFAEDINLGGRNFEFVFSMNALDHTQNLEASFLTILDVLSSRGIALICVNTREGERQQYQGLHKYDIWSEKGDIFWKDRASATRSIREFHPSLAIGEIVRNNDQECMFLITKS